MEIFGKKMTETVHDLMEAYVHSGDCAIDATMGNGLDTLKLCQCVGASGSVYAFDIQPAALEHTGMLLEENGMTQAKLICDSHEHILNYVSEPIQAFVFNLGYLPNGDRTVTTQSDSTVRAVNACLSLLKPGGIGLILAYWGHPGGEKEKNNVDRLLAGLPSRHYEVMKLENHNRAHNPPILYAVKKQ